MQARIIILPSGQITIFIEEGNFEDAKQSLARFLAELKAQNLTFQSIDDVEQHRHVDQHLEAKHHVTTS